jgi:hypothetical protein
VVRTRSWGRSTARLAVVAAASAALLGLAHPALAARPAGRLPPADQAALARLFDPALRPLGLRLVRGALERPPTYAVDPHGQHLAIYVQPIGVYTSGDYLDNVTRVASIFLPAVFRRWRGLRSFDVCQEPPAALDPSAEPLPVTQLVVTRRGAGEVRWQHVTLAGLVAAARRPGPDLVLYLDHGLVTNPLYGQATQPSAPG